VNQPIASTGQYQSHLLHRAPLPISILTHRCWLPAAALFALGNFTLYYPKGVALADTYAWKGFELTEQGIWLRIRMANTPERVERASQ
jgi:hypothetical protein